MKCTFEKQKRVEENVVAESSGENEIWERPGVATGIDNCVALTINKPL